MNGTATIECLDGGLWSEETECIRTGAKPILLILFKIANAHHTTTIEHSTLKINFV